MSGLFAVTPRIMATTANRDLSRTTIAYFISPHGYGHAARAAAVMAALAAQGPSVRFEIFTRVPAWFFQDSLALPFGYHDTPTDIGLVQKDSLNEDLPATIDRLDSFLPFEPTWLRELAGLVKRLKCRLVICDIAPLGIAVAHQAGLPAVLVENFTWDWIYEGYVSTNPRLRRHIAYLRDQFRAADYHIQTAPVCAARPAVLTTLPVSRKIRQPARELRRQLGIADQAKVVLLTMGGFSWRYNFLEQLAHQPDLHFIMPGAVQQVEQRDNLLLLPHQSGIFHPDLVNASDVVIGKLGYSTLAEVYQAGIPFGYVPRPRFRESPALAAYVEQNMSGMAITEADFETGRWLAYLPGLLVRPRRRRQVTGADQAARFIWNIVAGQK